MGLRSWRDVIETDFPETGPVLEETIEGIEKWRRKYRGGMRISDLRIWKDEDFIQRRDKVLGTPLR